MQFLSINKPMGLKEVGRRFYINTSMNGYHLAVNELWEKPDEGTSPAAIPQGHRDLGRKKTTAPEAV